MNSFTDTHCHLTLPQFNGDRSAVLQRAIDIGLIKLLVPGIDLPSSKDATRLCELYPGILHAAVGFHPNTNYCIFNEELHSLISLAKNPNVVAIGEIGLDYYRLGNPKADQQCMFIQQLEIAEDLNLPVCIHNRDATSDILDILEKWLAKRKQSIKKKINGVFHSFSGDFNSAKKIIELGFMLGISGPITYPKNTELTDVVYQIGINHLVVETDAPFLAPQKVRGKRNEPKYVVQVIEKLSSIFNLPLEKVCQISNENADKLYHWGK